MKIKKEVIDKIITHAKKDAPVEACGYLAAKDGIVSKCYTMDNIDKSCEHFSFDPQEQFNVFRDARSEGLEICVVYHSHPATPARPSPEDIKLAFDPSISYVIVSLYEGRSEVKVFRIQDGIISEEALEVINDD